MENKSTNRVFAPAAPAPKASGLSWSDAMDELAKGNVVQSVDCYLFVRDGMVYASWNPDVNAPLDAKAPVRFRCLGWVVPVLFNLSLLERQAEQFLGKDYLGWVVCKDIDPANEIADGN